MQKGRRGGTAWRGSHARVRRLRPAGHRSRLADGARDRGRPRRAHPRTSSAAAASGSASSPTSRSPRSRPRPAWARARARPRSGWPSSSPAACSSRWKASTAKSAREALRLAAHKLSLPDAGPRAACGAVRSGVVKLRELQDLSVDELKHARARADRRGVPPAPAARHARSCENPDEDARDAPRRWRA